MSPKWLVMSYLASLLTNVILISGVLALIYWIGEKKSGWLFAYHDQLQIGLCWAFTLYLFLMSTVNGNATASLWGAHWTFFNLMIVASFVFNLLMVSKIHWLGSALASIGYLFYLPAAVTPLRLALCVAAVAVQWGLTAYGARIWSRRAVIYPLLVAYGALALAILGIGAPSKDGWFWARQIVAYALQAGLTYEYARMLVQLRRKNNQYQNEAARDRMTGLKNFGTFNTELQQLYQRHQRSGQSFWLFELDIDHFKRINDTYGHLVGNTVLETVAQTTLHYAHGLSYDTAVYRMGGEEFCLLLRNGHDDAEKAAAIARGLRQKLAALVFHGADGDVFSITVSLAAEHAQADDKHYLDIYNRVDQLLYAVKRAGRDAVNVHGVTLR